MNAADTSYSFADADNSMLVLIAGFQKTGTSNVSSGRLPLVLHFLTFFSKYHISRRIRRYKW